MREAPATAKLSPTKRLLSRTSQRNGNPSSLGSGCPAKKGNVSWRARAPRRLPPPPHPRNKKKRGVQAEHQSSGPMGSTATAIRSPQRSHRWHRKSPRPRGHGKRLSYRLAPRHMKEQAASHSATTKPKQRFIPATIETLTTAHPFGALNSQRTLTVFSTASPFSARE